MMMADETSEATSLENLTEKTSENNSTSDEERLLKAALDKDVSEVRRLSSQWNIKIDHVDKNGMTALMHSSYKGCSESVDILITHGADVNRKSLDHEYTPLMFATLAGSTECVQLLLSAGADPLSVNKIGKTATQMGAFVGRHECVSLINNYIAKQDIEYYTRPQGLEKEPKLAPFLAEPLQKFIIISNLHPVYVCLFLQENISLVQNSKQVSKILDLKRERLFKKEVNEVMAMKVHCFACVYEKCVKWNSTQDGIEGFIKKLLKGREKDGFPLAMEDFLRESIRSFPYYESNLLKQLVRIISPVERGAEPTALSALTQAINGLQSANFSNSCVACGQADSTKKCCKCKMTKYCSQDCQKRHWFTHKKHCKNLAAQYQREQEELARLEKEAAAKEETEKEAENDVVETIGSTSLTDEKRTANPDEQEISTQELKANSEEKAIENLDITKDS